MKATTFIAWSVESEVDLCA